MNIGSLFSGIGSFLGGQTSAKGYKAAAKMYNQAAGFADLAGKVKNNMLIRQARQIGGAAVAAVGHAGGQLMGSAMDVLRGNRQQAYLDKAVNVLNTKIEVASYKAQAASASAAAKAAKSGGIMGAIGGVLGMFSDDRMKENVVQVAVRGDGLGIYHFNYKGSDITFEGVMANEVEAVYPDAVSVSEGGFKKVDYDKIKFEFKRVY